jgi:hypothetical protein
MERILSDHQIYCCMGIQEEDTLAAILQNTESCEKVGSENTQSGLMLTELTQITKYWAVMILSEEHKAMRSDQITV